MDAKIARGSEPLVGADSAVPTSPGDGSTPVDAWLPIATAPRGVMLLFCSMNPMVQARDWCWVDWISDRGMMLRPGGLVTHWMPLPAPPSACLEPSGSTGPADAGSHETLRAVSLSTSGQLTFEVHGKRETINFSTGADGCKAWSMLRDIECALAASASAPAAPREVGGAAPTSTPLDALIARWRDEAAKVSVPDDPTGSYNVAMLACADELEAALAAAPASALVTRTERLDDLRTIAAFAMAQGEDDVENAGIRVMLALDHPELLAASPAPALVTGENK
jgi:hypothetical protein